MFTFAEIEKLHGLGYTNEQVINLAKESANNGNVQKKPEDSGTDNSETETNQNTPPDVKQPNKPTDSETSESTLYDQLSKKVETLIDVIQAQNVANTHVEVTKDNQSVGEMLASVMNGTHKKEE